MCNGCWIQYGQPTQSNPDIEVLAEKIGQLYEAEPMGGPLHAVVDDWNLEGDIEVWQDGDFDDDIMTLAQEIADLMNGMPLKDRAAALARGHGFVQETADV